MNNRNWEYSPEPRLEGLLKQLKYIKWENNNEAYKNVLKGDSLKWNKNQ